MLQNTIYFVEGVGGETKIKRNAPFYELVASLCWVASGKICRDLSAAEFLGKLSNWAKASRLAGISTSSGWPSAPSTQMALIAAQTDNTKAPA